MVGTSLFGAVHGGQTAPPTGLIALDFDGTIVDRSGIVSVRTAEVLAVAARRGWAVVGATGRPQSLCVGVLEQLPAMRFLVASNGAEVFRVGESDPEFSRDIAAADATAAIDAIRARWPSARFCLGCVDGTQVWEPGFESAVPLAPVGEPIDDVGDAISGPVRTIIVFGEPVTGLGPNATAALDAVVVSAASLLGAADSGLGLPEIRRRDVSKASALEELRHRLAVSPEATIAFGDGLNDHEMLRWAQRGVAMAGADAATLMLADDVTGSVQTDGVADWLERHLLAA